MNHNGEKEKCPDFNFCENAEDGCFIIKAVDCWPKEKGEAGSILYIGIFRLLLDKGSFNEDDREVLFLKDLFLNSGGKKAEINSIIDKAIGSFLQRAGRIKLLCAAK